MMESVSEVEVVDNPLDALEKIAEDNRWSVERSEEDELVLDVPGGWCTYRLYFVWQPEYSALQFCAQTDLSVSGGATGAMAELLSAVNARLWLGHFLLGEDEAAPVFRYTLLLSGHDGATMDQLEDLIDLGVAECERYYPAFHLAATEGLSADQAMAGAIIDVHGEA